MSKVEITVEELKAQLAAAEAKAAAAEQTAIELNEQLSLKEKHSTSKPVFTKDKVEYEVTIPKFKVTEQLIAKFPKGVKGIEAREYTAEELCKNTALQGALLSVSFGGIVELKSK